MVRAFSGTDSYGGEGNWLDSVDISNGVAHRQPGLEFLAIITWKNGADSSPRVKNEGEYGTIQDLSDDLFQFAVRGYSSYKVRFSKISGNRNMFQPSRSMKQLSISLVSLINHHSQRMPHIAEGDEIRQYDARRNPPTGFPTPSGSIPLMRDIGNPSQSSPGPSSARRQAIDVLHLTFHPGQVDQFRHDIAPPDFRPVRSASAVAWNQWRREFLRQEGCEKLVWGIHENVIVLFICTLPS